MGHRPLILLNCSHRRRYGRDVQFWDGAYSDAVFEAGGEPLVTACIADPDHVKRLVAMADGFVLVGSDDIPPRWFGQKRHRRTRVMTSRRAAFDRLLAQTLLASSLPVLAVCGGLQLINVVAGGTLIQHLQSCDIHHGTSRQPKHHPLNIKPATHLHRILKKTSCEVNSFHHQAVETVGQGLRVCAVSEDGVVEGLETPDGRIVCVQWHPEREEGKGVTKSALFGWLITTAQKLRRNRPNKKSV